jgi:hypothetical protein
MSAAPIARRDGRTVPKLSPPKGRVGRTVSSHLTADDYRRFYELCMERNVSGNELIRQLDREAQR